MMQKMPLKFRFSSCVAMAFQLITLMWAAPSTAVVDINYFEAAVPVDSQAQKTRRDAFSQGLEAVFVRLSGDEAVAENPSIKQILSQAHTMVQQFQYRAITDPALIEKGLKQELVFRFAESKIKTILKDQAGLPYWPTNRPKVLMWIVEDSRAEGKQLLGAESPAPLVKSIEAVALRRGLPYQYPLQDLEDQLALSVDDIWSLNEEKILEASKRYQTNVVLVGRLSETSSGAYRATWQFFHGEATRVYDSRSADFSELANAALSPIANYLASRYAILPNAEDDSVLVLHLDGVESFAQYSSALAYLENLALLRDVALTEVQNTSLILNLSSEATTQRFINTLKLDRKMVPIGSGEAANAPAWEMSPMGTVSNPLRYRWMGS